jgi:signal peptidase II
MNKRAWIITLAPLFVSWGIDRITKLMALGIQGIDFYGPVGLVLHFNHGAMLGLFSDLPPLLRIVSLSTGGAFLLFSYAIIQFVLPIRSLMLRVGLSLLIGGILGNVADRIAWGYVVDFLIVGSLSQHTPAFNIADVVQWAGYGMIVWALIKEGEILWPSDNIRKQYWVNVKFQLRYCFTLMGVGLGFSLIAGIYSYTFLRVVIIDLVGENHRVLSQFLTPFILTFILVSIGFSAILFLLGRTLSHRTAGPLYAFEKYLQDIISGRIRPLKLRSRDEFKHLEELAHELSEKMRAHTNQPVEAESEPEAKKA